MCSHPSVMLTAPAAPTTGAVVDTTPLISAVQLRHRRDAYYLIDIREAEEIAQYPLVGEEEEDGINSNIKADVEVPMGKLLAKGVAEEWIDQRGIVLLCNSGYRATITARELVKVKPNTKVMALQHGILGLRNPAAVSPTTVIVLATHSNPEKITLALNAAAVAATSTTSTTSGSAGTVVLALLGDGVSSFLRKGSNKTDQDTEHTTYLVNETFVGEPFKPCQALLKTFVGSGNGIVLACKSCLAKRGLELGSDLIDCVQPMQMPDLMRFLSEATTTLQFM